MDTKYINKINENLATYLFSGVKSRASSFGGKYFYHFVRFNYFMKALMSLFFFKKIKTLEYYKDFEFIVIGSHFINEYIELQKSNNLLLIGSIKEYNIATKNKFNFYDATILYRILGFSNWNKNKISKKLLNEIEKTKEYIFNNSSKLKFVYINADLLPFYRAILSIFANTDIKIICPQHGLYTTEFQFGEIEGGLADINYVYDLHQKQILMNCGVSESSIIVYDFKKVNIINNLSNNIIKNDKIVIVSEGWHVNLGPKVFNYYLAVFKLYKLIVKNKKTPIIRLHPSEKYLRYLLFFLRLDTLNFKESVNNYNVYVGYSSTFLKEVKDAGKISIQLKQNFYSNIINMESFGYCNYTMNLFEFEKFIKY